MLKSESNLIPFNTVDPLEVFIYNFDIEFDGISGLDILEQYSSIK